MERPFYDTNEDRTNLVPGLQQDAPWVQVPAVSAGVESSRLQQYPLNNIPPHADSWTLECVHDVNGNIHGLASPPRGNWAYGYPNAIGPNAIYDAHHSYDAVDSNIKSLGYPSLHGNPFNQGLTPHFASQPYLGETIDGFLPLDDYATETAYGSSSAAYGTISAAYGASTNPGDLTEGSWPLTDPVSTSMSYNHGAANIIPSIYPPVPNPTLAPGPITTVQAEHNSILTSTDGSRPRCSTCNTTFKRASDLARHQKKHQPDRPFKCLVPRCSFKGAYRKDKLDAHVKSCHRRGAA